MDDVPSIYLDNDDLAKCPVMWQNFVNATNTNPKGGMAGKRKIIARLRKEHRGKIVEINSRYRTRKPNGQFVITIRSRRVVEFETEKDFIMFKVKWA